MILVSYLLPVGLCLALAFPQTGSDTQSTRFNKSFYRLGDRLLTLERAGERTDPGFTLLSWQESSALLREGAATFAEANGGTFVYLNAGGSRFDVELLSRRLTIHANRVFTFEGVKHVLRSQRCWSRSALFAVQKFSRFLIDEIFLSDHIVLLDRNEQQLRFTDFASDGRLMRQARKVHPGKALVGDAFVLTSDEEVYRKLTNKDLPVVLMSRNDHPDDGSLMKFCLRRNLSLVQLVSADPDPVVQQQWLEMIRDAVR